MQTPRNEEIRQDVFDRVQDVLDGRKRKVVKKYKHNEAFPLKPFVRCGRCGTPLTGGFARSKTSRLYPRYWCRTKGCRAVGVSRQELEDAFLNLLGRLSLPAEIECEFPETAARVWQSGQAEAKHIIKDLASQADKLRGLKKELLTRYLEGRVPDADYQRANADFTTELDRVEQRLREVSVATGRTDAFVEFAQRSLNDLGELWKKANDDQRRRVQTILFQNGLSFLPESKSLNPDNCTLRFRAHASGEFTVGVPDGI